MHIVLVGPEFEENLSLRYLAASLEQAGHTASLARFDAADNADGVIGQILRESPALVGLSMVFQVRAREFCALAQALRQSGYRGHITAGGHFATFACVPLLCDVPALDSIVRQEGEEALVELAEALDDGATSARLARIPGLVVRDDRGDVIIAPARHQPKLESLPYPVRTATPELHLGIPTAYLVGSRGCYADCEYCCIFAWHEAAVGKRYRMRTVADIATEMERLYHELGIRFFVFHDDNFFLPTPVGNRKRFEALRTEMRARRLHDVGLMLKLRPNDCDRDNMLILKEIGLLRAFVGIENASQRQIRSLGRDSTVEDVQSCLHLLRELEIYATYNILLFDPYTTLDDVEINLAFLRQNLFFPFNWCKVEPYAGTALERRYAQEGRLRGDYFGYDYTMDDPRARLLYDLLLPAFYYRNFDYYGLANQNIGLGYHRQLLKHFYSGNMAPRLERRVQGLIEAINGNTLDLLERACAFARQVDVNDHPEIERFGRRLREECFRWQRRYGIQIETVQRRIERTAGVRQERVGSVPAAFTPSESTNARRSLLLALAGGMAWLVAGCRSSRSAASQEDVALPPGSPPQGRVRVAPGHSAIVAPDEPMVLEALLQPMDAQVIGEPMVTASQGKILNVQRRESGRSLLITFLPEGASEWDTNFTITVSWTARSHDTDSVVVTRGFVHLGENGSCVYGYETPRYTIAEMAAPPLRSGPRPPTTGPAKTQSKSGGSNYGP
jgi:radical SAM superfamily enzyme YgiQ (UPF0313 family)